MITENSTRLGTKFTWKIPKNSAITIMLIMVKMMMKGPIIIRFKCVIAPISLLLRTLIAKTYSNINMLTSINLNTKKLLLEKNMPANAGLAPKNIFRNRALAHCAWSSHSLF